ncbi:MAG: hypothetical protein HYZ25_16615 [Chloroflexi bacterium]|nr:hypothetical protein [Chloroflexota bacterium]
MPRLSVWFVRASMIYLLLGFLIGALLLAQKGIPFYAPVWYLFPLHMEFLLVGWLIQLAMGIAFWIVPRFRSDQPRGNVNLVWGVLVLLNMGIVMVAIHPFISVGWFSLAGRFLEISSALLFVLALWKRVKPMDADNRA